MAFYKDPLFGFLTFYDDNTIALEGASTEWKSSSPAGFGYPDADVLNTYISNRRLN